jgi:nitrile hydratase subunit beta
MTDTRPPRSHHDLGGRPAGAIEPTEHDYALWEKRVDALMMLLSDKDRRLVTTDELRRNIESLGADAYDKMTYYERWIFAITQTLLQRGVISVDELGRRIEAVRAREGQGG